MKHALSKLVISALALLTALFDLGTARVRARIVAPPAGRQVPAPRANLRIVSLMGKRQQLTQALVGLGFRAAEVRAFVAGVNEREALADLIKQGLGKLGRAA